MFGLWASGLEYQLSGFRAWVVGSRFRLTVRIAVLGLI